MIPKDKLRTHIDDLLLRTGFTIQSKTIELCAAGGNNRIYKVETESDFYVVKHYFKSDGDLRDRLGAEFAFLSYAQSVAAGVTPRPYAFDTTTGMALYEFLIGQPFSPGGVRPGHMEEAISFFRKLNDPVKRQAAQSLPFSSEACFSFNEHINLVDDRIQRLLEMPQYSNEDRDAHQFVGHLASFWDGFTEEVVRQIDALGLDYDAPLIPDEWCISPSDFGFHNALSGANGRTHFIDFEYAGWDDPSRMVADFFSQMAIPVPEKYFNQFVKKVMTVFPEPERLVQRARLLLPVYRIKWCCIVLNIFLPVHLKRRLFANPQLDEKVLKRKQLSKAERIIESIRKGVNDGLH